MLNLNKAISYLFGGLLAVSSAMTYAQQFSPSEGTSKSQPIQTTETGWQVICRATTQDRTKLGCSVVHETYSSQDRVRLTSVEILKSDKGKLMIVSVPQGVSLNEGIEFSIDGIKQSRINYSYCMNNNCFSTLELTDTHIANLKKGKTMEIAFFDLQGSKIKTEIFLTGFLQAIVKSE